MEDEAGLPRLTASVLRSTYDAVLRLAADESRTVSSMVRRLLDEALTARALKPLV